MSTSKQSLARRLDDIMYLPEYRRGLGYRQLMRRNVRQLEEELARHLMTRWQTRATTARAYAAHLERRGLEEEALWHLYIADAECENRSDDQPVDAPSVL